MKWKNPEKLGSMSIHERFKDAVKSRASMAYQGQGYTYILHDNILDKDPLTCKRRVPKMESSVPVHQWNTSVAVIVIVNDMVEFATLGKSSHVARVEDELYQDAQWQDDGYRLFQCHLDVFLRFRLQTLATAVYATGGEDRTPHQTQHTLMFSR